MPVRTTQPQGGPLRLATGNPLTRGAQAVIVASASTNVVTGRALARVGSGYLKSTVTAGVATSFRENFYLQTEVLPAIGTAPYVEIWIGYPTAKVGPKSPTMDAKFLTGSSANQIGIFQNNRAGASGWGGLHIWGNSLNTSSDVLAVGKLAVLVTVRRTSGMELWRDGVLLQTFTQSPTSMAAQSMLLGAFVEDVVYWSTSSDTVMAARIKAEWSANDVKSFSANPWQLIEAPQPIYLYAAPAAGGASYTLACAAGAYSLSGASAGLVAAHRVAAAQGSYALTGNDIAMRAAHRLVAASGAYTINGSAVTNPGEEVPPATGGGGAYGGSGSPREVRAFADLLTKTRPTKAAKKRLRRVLEVEALELLPDEPEAIKAAQEIAAVVAKKELQAIERRPVAAEPLKTLPFDPSEMIRKMVEEWIANEAIRQDLEDEDEAEMLLMG